jgi:cytochrome P450
MFLAGHETTSTALGWMVYHLATLPEIQQKLKEEVDRVLQGKPITQDNIREVSRFRKLEIRLSTLTFRYCS